MARIERYIFRLAAAASLSAMLGLTGVVWVTQALRQLDLLTHKGQSLLMFFILTGLTIPSLIGIIAPVALFAGVIYSLNKLNGDSELVVMSAAGLSPYRLLRPFMALFCIVFAFSAYLYLQAMPWSFNAIKNLTSQVHADFIANFARPGAFTELESGFTFHYRERGADGSLRGVFMQDSRDPAHATTYIAEAGNIVESNGSNYLLLSKGTYQKPASSGDSAIITFNDYSIDLSQFIKRGDTAKKPRERSTAELIWGEKDVSGDARGGRLSSELVDRFVSPFFAFVAGLIAFAALGEARTTRQGRGAAILLAILAFTALRMLSFTATSLAARNPQGVWLALSIPAIATLLSLDAIFLGPLSRGFQRLRPPALKIQ